MLHDHHWQFTNPTRAQIERHNERNNGLGAWLVKIPVRNWIDPSKYLWPKIRRVAFGVSAAKIEVRVEDEDNAYPESGWFGASSGTPGAEPCIAWCPIVFDASGLPQSVALADAPAPTGGKQ